MYCGDETGAFIGDVGSHTARFGFGGEDCPKVVVPSAVYSQHSSSDGGGKASSQRTNAKRGKYSAPVSLMRMPPEGCFSETSNDVNDGVGFVPIYQSQNSNNQNSSHDVDDDGVIQDIDAWAALWEYSYGALCVRGKGKHTMGYKKYRPEPEVLSKEAVPSKKTQTLSSQSTIEVDGPIDHPLLAVDSTSRTASTKVHQKQRSLMLETLFESLSAPAAYIAPSPMLSSFAFGRQTSLVVDIGHSGTKVTPLVDGYCLSQGCVSSGRGGKWLGNIQKSVLEGGWDMNGTALNKWNGWGCVPPCQEGGIIPRYRLHSTFPENFPEKKLEMLKHSSFHSVAIHEVMYEMMTTPHIIALERSYDETSPFCGYGNSDAHNKNDADDDVNMEEDKKEDDEDGCYVLPDGTRVDLTQSRAGKDLCRLPELLFSETLPSFIQPLPTSDDSGKYSGNMLSLQHLIHKSLTQILDADMRKELSSNIILTGSASLFPTLDKRLSIELGKVLPSSYKYKVIGSKNSVENRYSAWIGGSVLSSLGSFQQLWLSKREYEECGALLGLQRFKS